MSPSHLCRSDPLLSSVLAQPYGKLWHRDALALCSDSWEAGFRIQEAGFRTPMYKDPCTTVSQNGPWDYNDSWVSDFLL